MGKYESGPSLQTPSQLPFLSDLYVQCAPDAALLAEYPSSNSEETPFRNRDRYIIHDPFPPPSSKLLKWLGPHHLMCGWGRNLPVTSQVRPPDLLTDHWRQVFGDEGVPDWIPDSADRPLITLFPHESVPAELQVVDPAVNYALHSKQVIAEIDCPQAAVMATPNPPCIVKLSHGYAGLGNHVVTTDDELRQVQQSIEDNWPNATLVYNEVLSNITGDYGVQFYLRRDGTPIWLGFTEQQFDDQDRWCGGRFSSELQSNLQPHFVPHVEAVARHLHNRGYFGVIGIDILRAKGDRYFLVDVNPRLTGITPFLIASRQFTEQGWTAGIYRASCRYPGSMLELVEEVSTNQEGPVLVLAALEEEGSQSTLCHLSASSHSLHHSQRLLAKLLKES